MLNSSDFCANSLQDQHTLQGQDLLDICAIASQETYLDNIYEKIETWSFEQFFGLTCHLFITTESNQSREQLSHILPKFGSVAVCSLLKIISKFNTPIPPQPEVKQLALSSLKRMDSQPLISGLSKAIENSFTDNDSLESIAPTLIELASHHKASLFSELAKRLSTNSWNSLQTTLLSTLADLRRESRFEDRDRHIKIRIKREKLEKVLVEVA